MPTADRLCSRTLFPIFIAGLIACNDTPRALLFQVDLEEPLEVPDDIDELEVLFVAARVSSVGVEYCTLPIREVFELDESSELPLDIALYPGELYDSWTVMRIVAKRQDQTVLRHELLASWPDSGMHQETVTLSQSCYERLCEDAPNERCQDGECVGVPAPDVFDADTTTEQITCEL